jgi:hypothetical protein
LVDTNVGSFEGNRSTVKPRDHAKYVTVPIAGPLQYYLTINEEAAFCYEDSSATIWIQRNTGESLDRRSRSIRCQDTGAQFGVVCKILVERTQTFFETPDPFPVVPVLIIA